MGKGRGNVTVNVIDNGSSRKQRYGNLQKRLIKSIPGGKRKSGVSRFQDGK